MSIFNAKYLSDQEIWTIISGIRQEQQQTKLLLAQPEISTNPEKLAPLAKRLYELDGFLAHVDELSNYLKDLADLEEIISIEENEAELAQYHVLHEDYYNRVSQKARYIYDVLLDDGYLEQEKEDEIDLKILNFFDYAGAEYAWRLGINVGIDVEESRERIENLLSKGLIERVQGTMLGGYHRQRDWVKHMNHTYYRISRKGRHYLRELRRGDEAEEEL